MQNQGVKQNPPNILVLISGQGRGLRNLLQISAQSKGDEAQQFASHRFNVACVVTSNEASPILSELGERGIPWHLKKFANKEADLPWLYELCKQHAISLLVMSGYLRKLPMAPWLAKRVINIHPSLLPKYGGRGMYGLKVHQAVLAAGEVSSGATVHWADAEFDSGAHIAQLKFALSGLEDAEGLANKVFDVEKILLPYAISQVLPGLLPIS